MDIDNNVRFDEIPELGARAFGFYAQKIKRDKSHTGPCADVGTNPDGSARVDWTAGPPPEEVEMWEYKIIEFDPSSRKFKDTFAVSIESGYGNHGAQCLEKVFVPSGAPGFGGLVNNAMSPVRNSNGVNIGGLNEAKLTKSKNGRSTGHKVDLGGTFGDVLIGAGAGGFEGATRDVDDFEDALNAIAQSDRAEIKEVKEHAARVYWWCCDFPGSELDVARGLHN